MQTYRLTTIADLLLVPPDRRRALFAELETALDLLELALGDKAHGAFRPPFVWTDDGKRDVALQIGADELRLEITPGG